jgi:hypothetical protein
VRQRSKRRLNACDKRRMLRGHGVLEKAHTHTQNDDKTLHSRHTVSWCCIKVW